MITVAETEPFQKKIAKLLSTEEREALIAYLSENPNSGVIIQGTGGIRKLRWARGNKGKSGGIREIYQKQSKNLLNIGGRKMGKAFDEISAGLTDAIQHGKGKPTGVIEHKIEAVNVKAIREKTGMSQEKFCATFGISIGTLRHWEQGLRSPRGPARVLLKVMQYNPNAIIEAIQH